MPRRCPLLSERSLGDSSHRPAQVSTFCLISSPYSIRCACSNVVLFWFKCSNHPLRRVLYRAILVRHYLSAPFQDCSHCSVLVKPYLPFCPTTPSLWRIHWLCRGKSVKWSVITGNRKSVTRMIRQSYRKVITINFKKGPQGPFFLS